MRLDGKTVLVTGGLRGIGRAMADRFASEGATVFVTDIDDVTQACSLLGENTPIRFIKANVAVEDDWVNVAINIERSCGGLDCLVNNAGVDCVGPIEETNLDAWRRIMSINVDGAFLGVKHCHPLLSRNAIVGVGSSIINVSSIMGKVGYPDTSAYNTSKGAITLFTKAIAIEFATKKTKIRVNSLHPGFVRTPLLEAGMNRLVEKGVAENAEALIEMLGAMTPLGRVAEPAEIANAALFLASDESRYVTGAEFVVDGGWTAQ
jgi:NAD(P)-dependent dehydrogenase (short-subunit alcohol dehydrogenase family)